MRSNLAFLLIACVVALACYVTQGLPALEDGAMDGFRQTVRVLPVFGLGVLVAGCVAVLLPRTWISQWLGAQSGWRGLVAATALGICMPGGPFAAFPLVYALHRAGADVGALIAFLLAWSTLGLQRILQWELPFLGLDFVFVRVVTCLPVPIVAGLLARWLASRFHVMSPRDAR